QEDDSNDTEGSSLKREVVQHQDSNGNSSCSIIFLHFFLMSFSSNCIGSGKSRLKSNLSMESDSKPSVDPIRSRYHCTECSKSFANKFSLQRHLRVHDG